ncbi:MAG: lipid-binding SYLF domain-containing protein [Pseudobdellovibrionaceae bacterium]
MKTVLQFKSKWISVLLAAMSLPALAFAGTNDDLQRRAQNAAYVFTDIMNNAEQTIPLSLLKKATCIATIPDVVRVGFIVGVRSGDGVVSCRVPGGWSEPSFLSLRSASYGAQIGLAASDLVLVFTTSRAIENLSKDGFTIGAGLSAAAGPVGRDAQAGIDYELRNEIYSYSKSRGLFAGATVEGSSLQVDRQSNSVVYGGASAQQILSKESRSSSLGWSYPKTLLGFTK